MSNMAKYKFAILKNEDADSHVQWEKACTKYGYEHVIIDLTSSTWIDNIVSYSPDCCLMRPPGRTLLFKTLYDERAYIINKVLGFKIYPKYEEILIHENKKFLSYWLKSKNIPHIDTHVFYNKDEALKYIGLVDLPLVGKTSIGSSGDGVAFLYTKEQAANYIMAAFASGVKRKAGPSARQGKLFKRLITRIINPRETIEKFKRYYTVFNEIQKGYVIFQKYIPHDYEWRAAKIGDSYFAHKKIKVGEMCSGSKGIEYVNPPLEILDFTKYVCDAGNFNCMSVDILEDSKGGYIINELQTIFGHVQDYILEVDGKPGRYIFKDKWIFEPGDFNTNLSFDLRLQNAVYLLDHSLQ